MLAAGSSFFWQNFEIQKKCSGYTSIWLKWVLVTIGIISFQMTSIPILGGEWGEGVVFDRVQQLQQ